MSTTTCAAWGLLASGKREDVETIFSQAGGPKAEIAQELLDSSPVGIKETPARLLLLRCVLQFAPRHVWSTVRLRETTLRWISGVQMLPEEEATNTDMCCLSAALRHHSPPSLTIGPLNMENWILEYRYENM